MKLDIINNGCQNSSWEQNSLKFNSSKGATVHTYTLVKKVTKPSSTDSGVIKSRPLDFIKVGMDCFCFFSYLTSAQYFVLLDTDSSVHLI